MDSSIRSLSHHGISFMKDASHHLSFVLLSHSMYKATRESAIYLNSKSDCDRPFSNITSRITAHQNDCSFELRPPIDNRNDISAWTLNSHVHTYGYINHLYEVLSYGPFHIYIASPYRIDLHFATTSPHWTIFSIHPHTLLALQLLLQPSNTEIPITFPDSMTSYQHESLLHYIKPFLHCLINPLIPVPTLTTSSFRVPPPPLSRPSPLFYTIRAHHVTTLATYLRQQLNVHRFHSTAYESLITGNIDIQPLWTRQNFYESYFKITLSFSNFYTCIQQVLQSSELRTTFTELAPLLRFTPEIRTMIIHELIRSTTSCSCSKSLFAESSIHCDKIYMSPPCFTPTSDRSYDCIIYGIVSTQNSTSSRPKRSTFYDATHAATVYCFSLKHYTQPDHATYPHYSDMNSIHNMANPVDAILKPLHTHTFPRFCNPELRMYI